MRIASVALLLLAIPAHADPSPADLSPADMVDPARLMNTIRQLPVARAPGATPADSQGLRDTEAWLQRALAELGYTPTSHEFRWAKRTRPKQGEPAPTPEETTWRNLIVELPGSSRPREVIILGAHFDAVPDSPGADDNATGVAALLEVARVLKDRPLQRTVRFVFFNLEEVGLVGSTRYVASLRPTLDQPAPPQPADPTDPTNPAAAPPPAPWPPPGEVAQGKERILAMLSFEMLGYFSDEPNSQRSPIKPIKGVFEPPTVGDSIVILGVPAHRAFNRRLDHAMRAAAPDLKVNLVDMLPPVDRNMMRSDHAPFLLAGIPAVMITDTADFRNPNYHTPTDTIETLDPARFTLVVRALAGAAYELAEPVPASKP